MRKWRYKRTGLIVLLFLILTSSLVCFLVQPDKLTRTEIYKGVYLTIKDIPISSGDFHKVMIVEIHWDTPGIEIRNRPFSFEVDPDDEEAPHYRLSNADWARFRTGAQILMNTTLYKPDNRTNSIPGMPVRSIETVIVDGQASHVHEHSYLLYTDRKGDGFQLTSKPPDPDSLSKAYWGIGIGGVQVVEGEARYNAIAKSDDLISRSFIGINPDKKILYLMAFEKSDWKTMIDEAVNAGVFYGGQVDSGSSTNLIIGFGANGVLPLTGIRGWRPLGGYLTVKAERLDQ